MKNYIYFANRNIKSNKMRSKLYILNFAALIIFWGTDINCAQADSKNKQDTIPESNLHVEEKDSISEEVSLLFLGDIMQHDLQIQSAYRPATKTYNFSSQFKHLKPLFQKTDIVVGNLEVTLSGPPYAGYPSFSAPDALAYEIKKSGINYLVTANNHIYDYGKRGFERTLSVLDSVGFEHTGTFKNKADYEKRHPMVIEKKGLKIALFTYTFGTNNDSVINPSVINYINKTKIKNDLLAAEKKDYDAVIIFFHWGIEYKHRPNQKMLSLTDFCFKNGADIVIGSHPHVIQPMEKYNYSSDKETKEVLAVYSLGNYVSNYATWRYCDGGAMIRFNLQIKDGKLKINNPEHYLIWVYRPIRKGKLRDYYVLPVGLYEKDKTMGQPYFNLMTRFISDSRKLLKKYNKEVPESNYSLLKD